MKKIAVVIFMLMPVLIFAQDDVYSSSKERKKEKVDSIVTETGFVVKEGDQIQVGRGSQDDGTFKYIVRNQAGFGTAMGNYNNINNNASRSRTQNDNDLSKAWSGYEATVVKFREYGKIKKPIIVFKGKQLGMKWEVDLDPAIETGEIVVPEIFRKKKDSLHPQQPISKADELAKLKKLMDDGVLSKEEFEAEKKKILEK